MNFPRPSPVALPCAAAFSFQEEYRWIQDDSWAVKPSSFLHRKGLIFLLNPSVQSPGPGPLLQVYRAVAKLKQGHRPAWSSTSDMQPRPSFCVHPVESILPSLTSAAVPEKSCTARRWQQKLPLLQIFMIIFKTKKGKWMYIAGL